MPAGGREKKERRWGEKKPHVLKIQVIAPQAIPNVFNYIDTALFTDSLVCQPLEGRRLSKFDIVPLSWVPLQVKPARNVTIYSKYKQLSWGYMYNRKEGTI